MALVIFGVYLYTLHPTVSPYRDSGDLIVAAHTEGIAHPPGYPLYVLSGKIFTMAVPFGNIAYRMNVMSAFYGAAAFVLLAQAVVLLLGTSIWLRVALLFLAFAPAYWRLSQVSEMYSMNAFFAALIIYIAAVLCLDPSREKQKKLILYLLGFICGIAATNHPTIILFYPVLLWLLWRQGGFEFQDYLRAGLFFAAGYSVYLFLPIRSSTGPISDWGHAADLNNFWRIITRSDYGGLKLHPEESKFSWTAGAVVGHLWVYLKSLGEQFTWMGAALGLWGIYLKRKERFFKFLLWSLVLAGPAFVVFSNLPPAEKTTLPILETHFVLSNVFFVFFIIAAAQKLIQFKSGKLLVALFTVFSFAANLPQCNYRGDFFGYDYGRNILSTIPENGIIYNPDDSTAFITSYFQVVGKKRGDIKLAAFFRTRWGYEQLRKRHPEILPARVIASGSELALVLLDYNRERFPVFSELPQKFPQGYAAHPYGLLYRLDTKAGEAPQGGPFEFYSTRNDFGANRDFFTGQVVSYYSASHNNLGLAYANAGRYEAARAEYIKALSIDPALEASLNNLGTLEYFRKNYTEAEKIFSQILKNSPGSATALFNLGLTYKAQNRTELARQKFLELWEQQGSIEAGNELGLMFLHSGRADQAAKIFTEIINRSPGYAYAYYNLGLALKQAGRYRESYMYFDKYLNAVTDLRERAEVQGIMKTLPQNR